MKLKILHLAQFLGVGGLEKVLLHLITEQISAGHEVELVVYDYEQSWVEFFRTQGIKVDTSFSKAKGYDSKLLKFIARKSRGFDVIHTHDLNPHMYAAPMKLLHSLLFKKFPRLVHTAHGMDHLHTRPVTKLYEKICSFSTNSTVGVSSAVCDYYRNLGLTPKNIVNINNGTLVAESSPLEISKAREEIRMSFKLPPEQLMWISVARVVPLKDQLLICELARQMPDMTFLIVGPSGDDEYWKAVELARDLLFLIK